MRIAILLFLCLSPPSLAQDRGTVHFKPHGDQQNIPERYRLAEHRFDWEMNRHQEIPGIGVEVFQVRFPSPVETAWKENNTVHAEYYRPKTDGPFPAVIVLDITGGNQQLSRTIARHLAQNGVGGLFVQMAYYGPRRPPNSSMRLLSYDLPHTLDAVKQTVLDMRRAAAWLEPRPEVDPKRLGILGTSLGSFMAALTCEMEPKLGRAAILLGGGGFVDAYYDHPLAKPHRDFWEKIGGTKEMVKSVLEPIDPISRAELLKDRKVLIVAARHDEIVPPKMSEALWNASGRQKILWLNAGHYSAILFLPAGLKDIVEHFK